MRGASWNLSNAGMGPREEGFNVRRNEIREKGESVYEEVAGYCVAECRITCRGRKRPVLLCACTCSVRAHLQAGLRACTGVCACGGLRACLPASLQACARNGCPLLLSSSCRVRPGLPQALLWPHLPAEVHLLPSKVLLLISKIRIQDGKSGFCRSSRFFCLVIWIKSVSGAIPASGYLFVRKRTISCLGILMKRKRPA